MKGIDMEFKQIKGIPDPICSRADFNADILVGKSIVIYGQSGRRATDKEGEFSRRFDLGDEAEYHSYNFRYTGKIVSIGQKTVGIDTRMEGVRRLSLLDFIRRNWNFDAAAVAAHNAAEHMTI